MTERNHRIRFMADNWATSANITASSASASFPVTNLGNEARSKVHRPTSMTDQWITVDLGASLEVGFVALTGPLGQPFGISHGATCKIQMSNLDQWASPPVDLTLPVTDRGAARFMDDQADSTYRYVRFSYSDPGNAIASFSHVYVGPYDTLTVSNVGRGFQKTTIDPSVEQVADDGARFYRSKPKYDLLENINMIYVKAADRRALESLVSRMGKSRPFYVSLDPTLLISTGLDEFTRWVQFAQEPVFVHEIADRFSMVGLSFREAQ